MRWRVGIDTGGTFTDFVAFVGGTLRTHKVLSTPRNPAVAVLRGLQELLPDTQPCVLTYGSTVATNALLERTGARVVLLTTAGFEEILDIVDGEAAVRSDIDDLEDRKMEREVRALELVAESERPEREARAKALRYKPATDMLGSMLAPSIQAFLHAKMNGGEIPPEMHPLLVQFASAYAQVQKVITEKDLEAMVGVLQPQKQPAKSLNAK